VELVDAYKNSFLKCGQCDKKSQLRKCVGIDYQDYNDNTGSPNGGYYEHSYYAWECPHCKCFRHNEITWDEFWQTFQSFKNTQERRKEEI
jgi:hypothetical protein